MDIGERARKWVHEYPPVCDEEPIYTEQDLINAYLAGSAQTQKDYSEHANGK